MTEVPARRPSAVRVVLRRVLAGVLALIALVPMFGLIDLGTLIGLADPAFRWEMPLEASWGCLFTFLVGGGSLALAVSRTARDGVLQLGIAVVALVVAGAAAADAGPLVVALGIAASLVVLGLLDPTLVRQRVSWTPSRPALVLAVAGIALWVPYSVAALGAARGGDDGDITNGVSHWPVQAALGVALLLGAGVLVVTADMWLRVGIVASGVVVGLTDLTYPDRAGANGPLWAAADLAWALLVAAAPLIERRFASPSTIPAD